MENKPAGEEEGVWRGVIGAVNRRDRLFTPALRRVGFAGMNGRADEPEKEPTEGDMPTEEDAAMGGGA